MKTALFGIVGWNIAETTRMIETAKWFQNEFECHFFSHGGKFEHLVEEAGFVLHRLEPREDDAKIQHLWKVDRGETFREPWTAREIETRTKHQIALLRELKPQFAFLGSVLGFSLSCRHENVLLFNLIPLALSKPYLEAGLPVSPYYPKWFNRLAGWMLLHLPLLMRSFRKVAKRFGLPKPKTFLDLWSGDVNIVAEAKELSLLPTLPKDWFFSGPLFAKLETPIPADVHNLLRATTKPKIYFAMGSSAHHDVLMKAIQAMDGLDAVVVAPIASHLTKDDQVPDNVVVTDWLPAGEVLSLVDVAVTHGGQGTVQTNAFCGVPFVGIGMQPEQELNIHLYKVFGCALQLPRKNLNPNTLRQAVLELLSNPSYKERAMAAKAILRAIDVKTIVRDIVHSHL